MHHVLVMNGDTLAYSFKIKGDEKDKRKHLPEITEEQEQSLLSIEQEILSKI